MVNAADLHDPAVEAAVVGAMLHSAGTVAEVRRILDVGDLWVPLHRRVFTAICTIHDQGEHPGLELVAAHTGDDPKALIDLHTGACLASQAPSYARRAAESAARRRLVGVCQNVLENAAEANLGELVGDLVDGAQAALVPIGAEPEGLVRWGEFLRETDDDAEWLIPGLIEAMDRIMVVAPEGRGKSTLFRQIALAVAAGVHPFTHKRINPVPTLLVDLENHPRLVRRKSRPVANAAQRAGDWDDDRAWLWSRPGGLDLRSRTHAAQLDTAIRDSGARLVCLGPLYKAFRQKSGENAHDVAGEVGDLIDDLRSRHNCAWIIEHHAPLRQGGNAREMRPFGSLRWQQWPEVGLGLTPAKDNPNRLLVGYFRASRDEREWPDALDRGTSWPWVGVWKKGMP